MSKVLTIKGDLRIPGSGSVKVGVLPGSGSEPDGIDLATLAQLLHDGTSTITPRPFIRQPLMSPGMQDDIVRLSTLVLDGKLDETTALRRIGESARGRILDAINERPYAPNTPSTIAAKGSDLPLVNLGVLKGAIAYRVIKGAAEVVAQAVTRAVGSAAKTSARIGKQIGKTGTKIGNAISVRKKKK